MKLHLFTVMFAALVTLMVPGVAFAQRTQEPVIATAAVCTVKAGQSAKDSKGRTVTNPGPGDVKINYTGQKEFDSATNTWCISEDITKVRTGTSNESENFSVNTNGEATEIDLKGDGSTVTITGGNATVTVPGDENTLSVGGSGNQVTFTGDDNSGDGTAGSSGNVTYGGGSGNSWGSTGNWTSGN